MMNVVKTTVACHWSNVRRCCRRWKLRVLRRLAFFQLLLLLMTPMIVELFITIIDIIIIMGLTIRVADFPLGACSPAR